MKFSILLALALAPALSTAITVNSTGSDSLGTSSFAAPGIWNSGLAPSPGNDYLVGPGHRLRTPPDGANYTFAGDRLILSDGGAPAAALGLSYKGVGNTAILTINDLVLDGGSINHLQGVPEVFNLAGNLTVTSDSYIHAKQGIINLLASISGNGTITNPGADGPGRILVFHSPSNTFNGNLVNNGEFRLAENATLHFNVESPGVNNAISGTGLTQLNGVFVIDTTNATSDLNDQWNLVTATNVTYGPTFTVQGWNQLTPGVWWDPTQTWRFTTNNGILLVTIPEDSDGDGLPDWWEDRFFGNNDGTATPAELALQSGSNDFDNDGLTNVQEFQIGTDPTKDDTDGDGLLDGAEVSGASNAFNGAPTNPLLADTDGDGLSDSAENTTPTNPNSKDTDNDGFDDAYELALGTNPDDPNSRPAQPAGFTLIENFQNMVVGQTFKDLNGWKSNADPLGTMVATDPSNANNQVGLLLRPTGVNNLITFKSLSALGLQILEGNSGTLFFQAFTPNTTLDHSLGLSDVANPVWFTDYEAQVAMIGATPTLAVRDGGAIRNHTGGGYRTGEWMSFWILIDNASDSVKVFVESPNGETGQIDITPNSESDPYGFRNGLAANALTTFMMVENAGNFPELLIDNIYVDPTSHNLSKPVGSGPSGPVITSISFSNGNLRVSFNPGGEGYLLTSSDDLLAPFTEVINATFDGDRTFTVPAFALRPGKDFFRVEKP